MSTPGNYTVTHQHAASRLLPDDEAFGSNTTTEKTFTKPQTFILSESTETIFFRLKGDGADKDTYQLTVKPEDQLFSRKFSTNDTLSDVINLDFRNFLLRRYRPRKFIFFKAKEAPITYFFNKPIRAQRRFYISPNQKIPLRINTNGLPANTQLFKDGILQTRDDLVRLSEVSLDPGSNLIFMLISPPLPNPTSTTASFPIDHEATSFLIGAVDKSRPFQKSSDIEFVGDAILQNSLSNPLKTQGLPASFGLGAVYNRVNDRLWFNKLRIEGYFNFASTTDMILIDPASQLNYSAQIRDLGTALLLPNTSRQSFYVNMRSYLRDIPPRFGSYGIERMLTKASSLISGINVRVVAANRIWSVIRERNAQGNVIRNTPIKVGLGGVSVGFFREFLPETLVKQNLSIIAGVDWTFRTITGDLRNTDYLASGKTYADTTIKNFQVNILKNEYIRFSGFDFNFLLQLKNIRASINYTLLRPFENRHFGIFPRRARDRQMRDDAAVLINNPANPGGPQIMTDPTSFRRFDRTVWPGLTDGQFSITIAFVGGFPVKLN